MPILFDGSATHQELLTRIKAGDEISLADPAGTNAGKDRRAGLGANGIAMSYSLLGRSWASSPTATGQTHTKGRSSSACEADGRSHPEKPNIVAVERDQQTVARNGGQAKDLIRGSGRSPTRTR